MLPQFFHESMLGAIAGNTTSPGNAIAILDACLVTGFNSQASLALSRTAQLVTVTKAGHGYVDWQLVTIAGATQTDYNGVFRIRRLDANTFTYTLAAGLTPSTPATGAITGLTTPLGWTKAFSATNKAAYRAPSGVRHYIRFDSTNTATDLTLWTEGFKAMTSISAGTGQFPTLARGGGNYVAGDRTRSVKPSTRTVGDPGWFLVGDDRRFIWMPAYFASQRIPLHFGEFKSYAAAEVNNTLFVGVSFATGANVDNIGSLTSTPQFPYHASPNAAYDVEVFGMASYTPVAPGNAANTVGPILMGSTTYGLTSGGSATKVFGDTLGDPLTTHDLILGHPLLLDQPVSISTNLSIRGKVQHLLCTAHNTDVSAATEKYLVSENVPVYGQVLSVGTSGLSAGGVGQSSLCFPLVDWETL